jgi:hypothetical protein
VHFMTTAQMRADGRMRRDVARLTAARQRLVAMFHDITRPVSPESGHSGLPSHYHDIRPIHIYRYVQALIAFGEADEMVRVMRWVFGAWECDGLLEEAKVLHSRDHHRMAAIFSCFNSAGEHLVQPEVMHAVRDEAQQLMDEKGCNWVCPQSSFDEDEVPFDMTIIERWMNLCEELGASSGGHNGWQPKKIPLK